MAVTQTKERLEQCTQMLEKEIGKKAELMQKIERLVMENREMEEVLSRSLWQILVE